jgi:putative sugar O-methyltransferase
MTSTWDIFEKQIEKEFSNNPESFLSQPTIRKTVHSFNKKIMKELYNRVNQDQRLSLIKDPAIGKPTLSKHGYSQSTLRTLYYIKELESNNIHINEINHITEIGAGYGNFCRIIKKLGYSDSHFLVDLDIMHKIQKKFLSKTCNLENLIFNKINKELIPPTTNSLFYATFSLNELPIIERQKLENTYNNYKYIFIVFNKEFPVSENIKIDNEVYFEKLKINLDKSHNVKIYKNNGLNGNILIGKRNDV